GAEISHRLPGPGFLSRSPCRGDSPAASFGIRRNSPAGPDAGCIPAAEEACVAIRRRSQALLRPPPAARLGRAPDCDWLLSGDYRVDHAWTVLRSAESRVSVCGAQSDVCVVVY